MAAHGWAVGAAVTSFVWVQALRYHTSDGDISDPVCMAEVKDLLASGAIDIKTKVWAEGMEEWVPLSECISLFPDLVEPAEPPAEAAAAVPFVAYRSLYYQIGDEKSDETPVAEAAALLAAGLIHDDTMVWTQSMDGWMKLGECRHLFGLRQLDEDVDYSSLKYRISDEETSEDTPVEEIARLLGTGVITDGTEVRMCLHPLSPRASLSNRRVALRSITVPSPGVGRGDEQLDSGRRGEGADPRTGRRCLGGGASLHYLALHRPARRRQ